MILIKAQMTVAAHARERFLQAMGIFVQASRAEPGCLGFTCYEDIATPNTFTVLEEWEDRASFERHEAAEHLAAFKTQIGSMIVSREATRVYMIDKVGRFPG